ncbi:lipocalin/fatty-acid binding family protein, partial [Salmonella enterica subsp. enterica serovar Typhi]|nr:lipocalin/fatty-acid binding family protein [Salmonella enterica subsp. enterica serovar Typhi]
RDFISLGPFSFSEYSSAEKEKGPSEMKSLLIALGLALCCLVQANQDQRLVDADLSKLNGPWVVGAIVTNCKDMKKMLAHMPASPVSFEQLSADEVKMTIDMAMGDRCRTMKPVLTRENGVFTTTCEGHGKKTVEYINLSGNSMMTEITLSSPKGQCKMATLSTRDLSDVQGFLRELEDFAGRHGLAGEKVHVLTTKGMCPRSS